MLPRAPEGILLSKNPHSVAARHFYEGTPQGEVVRVPWGYWWPVIRNWGVFICLYYLATFFLFGLLRKQWVEAERLAFPLARVPLEFTEGSGEPGPAAGARAEQGVPGGGGRHGASSASSA